MQLTATASPRRVIVTPRPSGRSNPASNASDLDRLLTIAAGLAGVASAAAMPARRAARPAVLRALAHE
jgi:hypothetical protein